MATGTPDSELVKVFDSEQESEAMVVKALLESQGIETLMTSLDAPQEVLPGVGGVILQVSPTDADRAMQVIDEYRNAPPLEEGQVIE